MVILPKQSPVSGISFGAEHAAAVVDNFLYTERVARASCKI